MNKLEKILGFRNMQESYINILTDEMETDALSFMSGDCRKAGQE